MMTLIVFFQSCIDLDLNKRQHRCIDRHQFKINNDPHCFTQVADSICGHCTNSFCLTQFMERVQEEEAK